MKRRLLYRVCFISGFAAVLLALLCRLHQDLTGREAVMSAQSMSLSKTNAEVAVESVKDAAMRLKCASLSDSEEIVREALASLSGAQGMSVGREDVIALLGVVEELESRRIVLSNGVSVAARDFARLEGDDFKAAVNAVCALRLFCAKASARFEGVGDVGSELWLVYSLTRAKTQLGRSGSAERKMLIDSWLDEVWDFVDTRECNSYKATKKLWDDGLPHVRAKGANDDCFKAFVEQVRNDFIDRIAKMGDGHVVPWSVEFTGDSPH